MVGFRISKCIFWWSIFWLPNIRSGGEYGQVRREILELVLSRLYSRCWSLVRGILRIRLAQAKLLNHSAPATSVPGPLPLFGAAAAFGFSRKLRKRIKLAPGALASSQPLA